MAIKAETCFAKFAVTGESPYLEQKLLHGLFGARLQGDMTVVPLTTVDLKLRSLQFIYPDGQKRFLGGGCIGAAFHAIGELHGEGTLFITEGFADAATVHQVTGATTVAAMSAHNLLAAARALREKFPTRKIIICGDDDRFNVGDSASNTGRLKAQEAGDAIGASVVFPAFKSSSTIGTDFNDLFCFEGATVVAEQLLKADTTHVQQAIAIQGCFSKPLSQYERRVIHWLWQGRIPYGCITILEGNGGVGKSFVISAIASAVSRGIALPEDGPADPIGVLLLASEDDPNVILRPRFESHGANLDLIRCHDQSMLLNAEGILALERDISENKIKLVVIDPIVSFLGAKVDMNSATDVRAVMSPLAEIARKHECAVLIIRHWNKNSIASASSRGSGSVDFRNSARSVLQIIKEQGIHYLTLEKSNYGAEGKTLTFGIVGGTVSWTGVSDKSADDILREAMGGSEERSLMTEACEFLKDELASGPIPAKDMMRMAKDSGISEATIRRARVKVGVKAGKRLGGRESFWELPGAQPPDAADHAHASRTCSRSLAMNNEQVRFEELTYANPPELAHEQVIQHAPKDTDELRFDPVDQTWETYL